ncbi:MAG: matrixin family metalloprotease, partial [Chlamydiota bacterium]|nr:matrixin family metalloprotease [Chlamydiota bacterium]
MIRRKSNILLCSALFILASCPSIWGFALLKAGSTNSGCTSLYDRHSFQSPSYIPYRVHSNFLPSESTPVSQNIQSVRNGMSTWSSNNANINFGEVGSGEKVYIYSQYEGAGYLAITVNQFSGNTITSSSIKFNEYYNWSANPSYNQYDIERVALHETGHVLGLHHPNDCDNYNWNYNCSLQSTPSTGSEVMNSSVSSGLKSHLVTNDERCGVDWLYGDTTAPSTIGNLNWTILGIYGSAIQIRFTWTAPGDDGSSGTAYAYDIRYRTDGAINTSNWSSSSQVSGEPTPSSSGSSEQMTYWIVAGTTYSVAIKSSDTNNNISGLSNVITINTDTEAPSTITDLAITEATLQSMTLEWTAPGDDGTSGTATTYDMRYSTSLITSGNFDSASQVPGLFSPQAYGTPEIFTVNGLNPNTIYYFAIKAIDESNNVSDMSNVVNQTTLLDTDGDGLADNIEVSFGSNPLLADSDGDGYDDLHEYIAGTDPNDEASYSETLFSENFDSVATVAELPYSWTESGQTGNVSWDISSSALVSTITGANYGYSYIAPSGKDFSTASEIAVSYDVAFTNGASWGGFWFRGIYMDLNRVRCGWRDNNYTYVSTPITDENTHHILILIHQASPYYLSDLYIDGKLIFSNEPIEVSSWPNNTLGFVSSYYTGSVVIDKLNVWPTPVVLPFTDNFDARSLGPWIKSGNSNINWSFNYGGIQANPSVSGTGYGYLKQALVDIDAKDITAEFSIGYFNGAIWGGFLYRNIYMDLNPQRIGWRDNNYSYISPGISANAMHRAVLVIKQSPLRSTLYIDG